MEFKNTLCSSFAAITFVVLTIISVTKFERLDLYAIFSLMWRTVPATIVMGVLGRLIGNILDSPKNLTDSDYQTDILRALKRLDKNMTLADLNEKLKPVEDMDDINLQKILEEEANKKDEPSE